MYYVHNVDIPNKKRANSYTLKVILCAYEHNILIVRYRYISFKQL